MSKHEVTYDEDGLATSDPWTLDEYLAEDKFSLKERDLIAESVLSWLTEYDTADCHITEAMKEITPDE